jgi:hypothetical protein
MAQWDGIGDTQDWGEYYAGRRAAPPASKLLDSNSERAAWEWAAVTRKIDNDRAERFAAYLQANEIGKVI